MKHVMHILSMVVMLTMFAASHGGVVIERCACSGRTSMALPIADSCCPGEGDCMSVTVVQLIGNYLPTLDIGLSPLQATLLQYAHISNAESAPLVFNPIPITDSPPNLRRQTHQVLRV